MNTHHDPLSTRYASKEMSALFSPYSKFLTWRKLWIALAKAQKKLGLPISDAQIAAMEKAADQIDLESAKLYEKQFRHDVMAHIHAFGDSCPEARGIIHLGATSSYVTDNTDLIQMKEALKLLQVKMVQALKNLYAFAEKHAALPCLSYTHFQPAQPTTVGKRACLWLQDLALDVADLDLLLKNIPFFGAKGATGTQASFLSLFEGDAKRALEMEKQIAREMGFDELLPISGQIYTRKIDIKIASFLASFAASTHKCATDLRLLSHLGEIEEPFEKEQIGSSAMPYKRNPMRSERICGLCRFLISLQENAFYTEATQWLERTLDDSSNRRLYLPQLFLTADAILNLVCNVTRSLTLYPKVIEKHLAEQLPFLSTEEILMQAVKKGRDRQVVHERLRMHSFAASRLMKEEGKPSDLMARIAHDPEIGLSGEEIEVDAKLLIGRAEEQTREFLHAVIDPLLQKYSDLKPYSPTIEL